MRSVARAFTLVEILVVIAVIALLLGLLAPAIAGVRASAREAQCVVTQKQIANATFMYMMENRSEIPGVNTTGHEFLFDPDLRREGMLGDQDPSTPTTTFDWISPVLGRTMGFSRNRAERTWQIFTELGCAASRRHNDKLYGTGAAHDAEDFQRILETKGFPQISYLSPGPFHLLGPAQSNIGQGRRFGWAGPAKPPERYKPRLERVGSPSAKVLLADGTRYVATRSILDFDIDPNPTYYSSFTESTPIYFASTAYGHKTQSPQFSGERRESRTVYPLNRNLSYRHGGRINCAYFDGHVASMDEATSKTDAAPWHPTGSVFTGVRATEESLAYHKVGDILP